LDITDITSPLIRYSRYRTVIFHHTFSTSCPGIFYNFC